jgi:nicotinamidase-related amidase
MIAAQLDPRERVADPALLVVEMRNEFVRASREAFHHGHRTTVVSDAVSSFVPHLHAGTLENFVMKFGWVADTDAVLAHP